MPDWYIHRYAAIASILSCGYCIDMGWHGCAVAWLVVAGVLMIWSVNGEFYP